MMKIVATYSIILMIIILRQMGGIMRDGIKFLILGMILLSLLIIEGSYQASKSIFLYRDLPLQKQIAISRGSQMSSSEMIIDENQANRIHELIVMTFNIHYGVNKLGQESLDLIIKAISDTQAHIIALQEVDRFLPRSGFKDQAKEIANALGYYHVYGETINVLGIKYGNAIISKFPILEYENKKLPGDSIETRGLLSAKIDVDGIPLQVYTTHLGLSVRDRKKQIKSINASVEQSTSPFVLMGDFNCGPFSQEILELSSILTDIAIETQKEELYTYAFHSDTPNTRVDRIYVSPHIDVIDYFVIDSAVSDHSMVLGVISINPKFREGLIAFTGNINN